MDGSNGVDDRYARRAQDRLTGTVRSLVDDWTSTGSLSDQVRHRMMEPCEVRTTRRVACHESV